VDIISGLEKYIGSVGASHERTTGVSNDTDEWKKNFADVLVDGDIGSELTRTAKVIADRVAAGLDASTQKTYKAQLLDASRAINGSSGMESKESTYGESYIKPINESSYVNNPRYQNAVERIIGPTNYEKLVEEGKKVGNEVVKIVAPEMNVTPAEAETNFTKLALIGGGALIAAAFVKGMLE